MLKRYQRLVFLTLVLGLCAGPALSTKIPQADEDFAMKAAKGGMMEVELGRMASEKASNPAVKSFGQRMVTDHSKAGDKLKGIAVKKGFTLPAEIDAEQKAEMEKLSQTTGADFDRAYMNMMVADHEKDVSEFQSEATSGQDPQLKAFAAATLPTLREHLRLARETAAKVK